LRCCSNVQLNVFPTPQGKERAVARHAAAPRLFLSFFAAAGGSS